MNTQLQRMLAGAAAFAAADRSDPFAFNRAMSHVLNGVASVTAAKDEHGKDIKVDMFYKADAFQEERKLQNGETFSITSYKNLERP